MAAVVAVDGSGREVSMDDVEKDIEKGAKNVPEDSASTSTTATSSAVKLSPTGGHKKYETAGGGPYKCCVKPCPFWNRCCCCCCFDTSTMLKKLACAVTWIACVVILIVVAGNQMGGLAASSFFLERHAECPYNNKKDILFNLTYWRVHGDPAKPGYLNIDTADQLHPGEKGKMGIPEVNTTTVSITTPDGVTLNGEYAGGHACGPVVILLHGNGMCLGKFEITIPATKMWEAGINVLAIDYRNHGASSNVIQKKSGKQVIMWGTTEYHDPLAAAAWLHTTKGFAWNKIGIYGASMGGATALIAAAKEPRLKSIWVDSPACDPWEILNHGGKKFGGGILAGISSPITDWGVAIGKSWMDDPTQWTTNQPYDVVKKYTADQSVQFVTTAGDDTVPSYVVKTCVDAAKTSKAKVSYWEYNDIKLHNTNTANKKFDKDRVADGTHVEAVLYDTDLYAKRIVDWYNSTLGMGCPAK